MTIIWCMVPEILSTTQIFLLFWAIFCPFTPQKPKKWKFWKNETDAKRYDHFTQVYQKSWSYAILFLRYGTWQDVIFIFHFGLFFAFIPLTAWKIKILKSIYTCVTIIMIRWCTILRYGVWWTDGRTDGKSDIERWVPHLKIWRKNKKSSCIPKNR